MTLTLTYTIIAFVAGFAVAWLIRTINMQQVKKSLKSTEGFLESERLKKETLRNDNMVAHQHKEATKMELGKKLKEAHAVMKRMDEDIMLMQQSNEETEALLKASNPEIHELKLKLIEAQNALARYKGAGGK